METKYNQLIAGFDIKFPQGSVKLNQKIFVTLSVSAKGQLSVRAQVQHIAVGDSIQTRDFLEK